MHKLFLTDQRIRKDVINNIWLFVPFGAGFYTIFQEKESLDCFVAFINTNRVDTIFYRIRNC